MLTATISEAKASFSTLIKKVQDGETIVLTSGRGKTPVAKLTPIRPATK